MSFIMDFFMQDVDNLFSYMTAQQVEVRDRALGFVNSALTLGILLYVVVYVFMFEKGYLEQEFAKGVSVAQFSGEVLARSALGDVHFFDHSEIDHPGLENNQVFVATKTIVQQEERGVCEDQFKRCRTPEDCSPDVGATCSPQKYCVEPSWCPVGDPEVYKLPTGSAHIWVKSGVTFRKLAGNKLFSTDMTNIIRFPNPHHNTYRITDLLQQCDPPVRFEEVSELGAAVEVTFIWNCQVSSPYPCEKILKARRVDNLLDQDHIGYEFDHVEYDPTNPDKRTRFKKFGIRFVFATIGTGSALSMQIIIFQVSTGMALVGFAPLLADIIMLKFLPNSKKYHARKIDLTPSFDDVYQVQDVAKELKSDILGQEEADEDDAEDELYDQEWRNNFNMDEDIT